MRSALNRGPLKFPMGSVICVMFYVFLCLCCLLLIIVRLFIAHAEHVVLLPSPFGQRPAKHRELGDAEALLATRKWCIHVYIYTYNEYYDNMLTI